MRCLLCFFLLFITLSCTSKTREEAVVPIEKEDVKEKPYNELKQEAKDKKAYFLKEYKAAPTQVQKDSVVQEAQKYLLNASDDFFKAWYNTPWTFHGHSQTPKEGTIACGYFVTTTLQDMGFNIPRVFWAQQASEYMIKKVTSDIKRFHNKPMKDVVDYIESNGEGLYIVGLDRHIGYIYYIGGKMTFVHANYYRPKIGVMSEPLIGRNPLNDSKYRVVGKIFGKEMVLNWMMDTPYSK